MGKLSYEDKINLYNDSKLGLSKSMLSKKYNIDEIKFKIKTIHRVK